MSEPESREWTYHWFQPDDIPADFPNRAGFLVLRDILHARGGSLHRFISCAGVPYVLVLEYNQHSRDCLENTLLEKIYQSFEERDIHAFRECVRLALKDCMTVFWPYLAKDYSERRKNGKLMNPLGPLDFERKENHKLQLKTMDGLIHAIANDSEGVDHFEPFENKFPGVRSFPKCDVEVLERLHTNVFRVKIQGQELCLKAGRSDVILSIEKLHMGPKVANVLPFSGVLVNGEGKILGMLTPFFSGSLLSNVSSITASQKTTWKAQISTAVKSLHKKSIVWGDAKPNNIIIDSVSCEPVLIDFEGGQTEDWVDEELRDTQEGDLQGLERILRFVDNIPTSDI